ncbi:MAG: DNA-3-methyladenine glycosylase [Luteitalea sp.]|nr:DNA-3-methyladenine glycosylase [Luteitalea sp.]
MLTRDVDPTRSTARARLESLQPGARSIDLEAVKLPRSFYSRPTLDVAHDLLGKVLVHRHRGATTSGIIVEVEAYIGEEDPACHAAPGRTLRNQPLYGPPGFSYVYLNYGIHSLVNVVAEPDGSPAAVLVRALDPLDGVATMRRRRGGAMKGRRATDPAALNVHDLCRGPGNLTMAMGIGLDANRLDLLGDRLLVEDRGVRIGPVRWGPRIGIRVGTERPWRGWVDGNPAVSRPTRISTQR